MFIPTAVLTHFLLPSSTANRHFLRAMARVGAGSEEFFDTKTKSKWECRVKQQLSKAFQPALTSVAVDWWQFDENAPKPIQVGELDTFQDILHVSSCYSDFVGTYESKVLVLLRVYSVCPHCSVNTLHDFRL